MEYKAHKESIKDASNRATVQREQAEHNIRQGAGHHVKVEKKNPKP